MARMRVLALLLLAAWVGATAPNFGCPEYCCCKVCSDENHEFYPYGPIDGILTTPKEQGGPVDPTLEGDLGYCQLPTWEMYEAGAPDTVWWVNMMRFGDTDPRLAPLSCTCCRFSGLHSNCIYDPPLATVPRDFTVLADPIAGQNVTIEVADGVTLTSDDYIEIRSSTECGYDDPAAELRATGLDHVPGYQPGTDATSMRINVTLPAAACYVLCYYHSQLTTPGWYNIGHLDVLPDPASMRVLSIADDMVVLEGETVEIVVGTDNGGAINTTTTETIVQSIGGGDFSIFGDRLEMRNGGSCGDADPAPLLASWGANKTTLEAPAGFEYCNPPLEARVSVEKPLRYLPIDPSDCDADRRLLLPQLVWRVRLPTSGAVDVCYYDSAEGTWSDIGTLTVPAKLTQREALTALYTATGGATWTHSAAWTLPQPECEWYGVTCAVVGGEHVVTGISLQGNNLTGSIPFDFARGVFPHVRVLNLARNALAGGIPKELGAWASLAALDLGHNLLTGVVPAALRHCPLRTVYLPANNLAEALPYSLRSLVVARSVWVESGGEASFTDSFVVPQPVAYISPPATTARTARCPTDTYFCPVEQVATGVAPCGEDGFNEDMCVAIGCCWNPQDTGKPCHTKRRANYDKYPRCEQLDCSPVTPAQLTPVPAPPTPAPVTPAPP